MKRRSHNPEDHDALRETIIRLGKRVSEENYRAIFDSANDAIIIHDKDTGKIIDVNRKMTEMYGYDPEESRNLNVEALSAGTPGYTQADALAFIRRAAEGAPQLFEWMARHKTGKLFWVEVNLKRIALGGKDRLLAMVRDITERKHAEELLRKAYEELEARVRERTADLSKANQGLLIEIEEHKRADEALKESEERYRFVTENAQDAIISIDDESRIILVNPATEKIFGYTSAEMYGRPLTMLMPERLRQSHFDSTKQYLATGRKHLSWDSVEVPGLHRDGREIPLELSFGEFVRNGKRFFTSIVRDISKRKKAEELLKRGKELGDALNDINTVVHSSVDLNYIAQQVAEKAARAVGAESSIIYMREDEEWTARYVYGFPQAVIGKTLAAEEIRYSILASKEKKIQIINDPLHDERVENYRAIERYGIKAMLDSALIVNDQLIGNFALHYHTADKKFTELEVDFIMKTSSAFTLALKNAVLFEERRQVEQSLKSVNERLSNVLNSITDAYFALDSEWRFVRVNPRAEAEVFKRPAQELLNRTYGELYPHALDAEFYRQYRTALIEKHPVHFEAYSVIAAKWFEAHVYPRNELLEVYLRDITRRKKMEESIRHQASHDELTGLANRMLFEDHFRLELAEARRNAKKLAVLFLDLDRFKVINDTLGHDAGDEVLKEAAGRLKMCTRESDTVARIGGDEFNILLTDMVQAEQAMPIIKKIAVCFREPFFIKGQELHITASIGISIYPDDSQDIQTLLKYADIAMYHAKEKGRNNYQFYSSTINIRTIERLRLENELRQALERGELTLYYQPEVDINTGRLVSVEALLRWQHPELGLLRPGQFIRIAEETGLIIPIGEWILRTACAQNKLWQSAGNPPVRMTINLSGRQFNQPDLAEITLRIFRECNCDPQWLQFEITETTAMRNISFTISRMRELAEKGISFSLDDFGTGCSSLSSLKQLPIQKLKIDKSFIEDIPHDSDHRAIVSAVIAMSHSLKLKTIAEGVERDDQLSFLRSNDCDEMQGYLIREPLPSEKFGEVVAAGG